MIGFQQTSTDSAQWIAPPNPGDLKERKQLQKSGKGTIDTESIGRGLPEENCGLHRGKRQPIHDDLAGR